MGQGSFGTVQKIIDISEGKFKALKISKAENDAITSIFQEVKMLNLVNDSSLRTGGLQQAASNVLEFPQNMVGYITKLYNHASLARSIHSISAEHLSKLQYNKLILSLFEGLESLHKKNIVHGDIKPDNCLVHKDGQPNSTWQIVIGDVGGAVTSSELYKEKKVGTIGTIWTPGYLTDTDYEDLRIPNQQFDEWLELVKKRDIFALAATAWFLITEANPYPTFDKVADTSRGIKNEGIAQLKVGNEVASILMQALSEYSDERPEIEEIIEVLLRNL